MEGLRFGQGGNSPRSPRGRLILLVVLAPAFLGASYFLFVEYVLQNRLAGEPAIRLTLRVGGAALAVLALILAAACGYLLVDRVTRPLRLLLRLAESGDLPANRAAFQRGRGPEIYELYRLVSVLVNQNKAGGRALEELERLRAALVGLREEVARTGQHGILPPMTPRLEGPIAEVESHLEAKRLQLLSFFRELRERVVALRSELQALGVAAGFEPAEESGIPEDPSTETSPAPAVDELPASPRRAAEVSAGGEAVHEAVQRLRQLGTVTILEAGRAGEIPAQRVSELFGRFQGVLEELDGTIAKLIACALAEDESASDVIGQSARQAEDESRAAVEAQAKEQWRRLLDGIDTLERRLAEVEER